MCWQRGTRQDPHGQHLLSVRHGSLLVATASPHAPSCIHRNKWLTACWKVCVCCTLVDGIIEGAQGVGPAPLGSSLNREGASGWSLGVLLLVVLFPCLFLA